MHGLGYTAEKWDSAFKYGISEFPAPVYSSTTSTPSSGSSLGQKQHGSVSHALGAAVKHIAAAPASSLGTALAGAVVHVAAAAGMQLGVVVPTTCEADRIAAMGISERLEGSVRVDRIENAMYIDDSDSMNGPHFFEARRALNRMAQNLGTAPTRIVKFGSSPMVLAPRSGVGLGGEAVRKAAKSWDGSSGGTYMWKMIEDDIFEQYVPGSGRLRIFIITDGMDELSPRAYRGLGGMDPMMNSLRFAGFDVEFFIVVVGSLTNMPGTVRYRDLACSTGGAFLSINHRFDELASESQKFLSALAQSSASHDESSSGRLQRRLEHQQAKRLE